jgi:hypothetical protein
MDEYHTIFLHIRFTQPLPTYKFYISILILYFIDANILNTQGVVERVMKPSGTYPNIVLYSSHSLGFFLF